MTPTQQGLAAGDLLGVGIEQRLIEQFEFALRQRLAQVGLKMASRLELGIHLRFEESIGRPAVRLRPVKRHVCVAHKLFGRPPVMGRHGDPDAASDDDLMAAEIERLVEHLDDPLRQGAGVLGPIDVDLQDGELVSTEPRHRVGFANARAQPGGDRAQQRIADRMAECIVHVLEFVQIEAQHGLPGLAPRAQQGLHHGLVERGAVRQLRQRVMTGHVLDLGLGQRPLGDVLVSGDPPASVHRMVYDGDRPAVRRVDDLLGR